MTDPISAGSATDVDETRAHEQLAELADDFTARYRRGERPSVDEYARKHPELADQIRDLFAALIMMEADTIGRGFTVAGDVPVAERPGQTIGRYKLLERIGEGGFGVVFLAEQQHPVRRKVALKVVKPGVDTRQVIARFEAERQALALMDHPNIAKVLDAGATDSGRPYFVMELVRGVPITEYCDTAHLGPRERLELFVHVCRAVQHAHTKGIIHRDIKPSNVLVSVQEGVAVPKVIDFGIAKATGHQLTEKTLFTNFAQMVGTPLYMSPEQAEMSGLDVDTRSDVYSLGVLLYELLTGTTPFDKERLRHAAYDEVRRIIREEEPPRPSTRISTMGDKQATVAAHFKTDPRRLGQIVRGELDWIVMKALEKDRSRRYETANGLARDVERYLHDEAVEACPPSTVYRLGKFARRNKVALSAASGVLGALLVIIAILAYGIHIITAERNEKTLALVAKEKALMDAELQRERSEKNFERARVAIRDILSRAARGTGDWSQLSPALRQRFMEKTVQFYESLLQEGSSDPTLRYETAVGYWSLSFIHGPAQHQKAEKLARQSIEILETLASEYPKVPEYRHQLGWANFVSGLSLLNAGRPAEAEAAMRVGAGLYETLLAEGPRADYPVDMVVVYRALGELALKDKRPEQAEAAFRRSAAMHEMQVTKYPDTVGNPIQYSISYGHLLNLLLESGRRREAAEVIRGRLQLEPNDHIHWYDAAAMYLWSGDVAEYRRTCAGMLEQFSEAADRPEIAERIAKTCCLAPDAVADFGRVEKLADRAVNGNEKHALYRYFVLSKGMTEFRAGRYVQAVEWLNRFSPKTSGRHFDAAAFATMAMALHREGSTADARAKLAAAESILATRPKDLGAWGNLRDWLHADILCGEAKALLKGEAANP